VGNKDKTDTEKRLEIKDQRPDTEREREREKRELGQWNHHHLVCLPEKFEWDPINQKLS
jgi:hypothetical protein